VLFPLPLPTNPSTLTSWPKINTETNSNYKPHNNHPFPYVLLYLKLNANHLLMHWLDVLGIIKAMSVFLPMLK